MSSSHKPVAIANHFISLNKDSGFTLMQLLKLSYIAHGFNLVLSDKALANELVQAWKYGPVFASIYNTFKAEPIGKIKDYAEYFNEDKGGFERINSNFNSEEKKIMKLVYKIYGDVDGWRLSSLTHQEGTPWDEAYNTKGGGKDFHGVTISNENIKKHFKDKVLQKHRSSQ